MRKRLGQHWPGWLPEKLLMGIQAGHPLQFVMGISIKHIPTGDDAAIRLIDQLTAPSTPSSLTTFSATQSDVEQFYQQDMLLLTSKQRGFCLIKPAYAQSDCGNALAAIFNPPVSGK